MAITFENEKILFDDKYGTAKEIDCFLPVHLTIGGKENDLYKKDGSHNEQYYKWQFLYCFVSAGLCSKDFIGVEVSFPKGNKNSASIKLDAAIFDNKDWFEHYSALHTKKDDSKWDELNWLKEHLICGIEFKKEGSKDIKGVFNSQLKAYMNESSKETVFGILYDEGRLYLFKFKAKQHLVHNYSNGFSTVAEMGFSICRGQNLQISNIGLSIQTKQAVEGYYTLILPNYITKYGTISQTQFIGNSYDLKTLKPGDIIFGAEGNEKGRSLVVFESDKKTITNIHGITLNHDSDNLNKSVFVKLFLDWYRQNGMIDAYAVGGNGGSLAIKYWDILKFPNFDINKENEIVSLYYSPLNIYNPAECNFETFLNYDQQFNEAAGIYEIDKSLKYLQAKLDKAIQNIADNVEVDIAF